MVDEELDEKPSRSLTEYWSIVRRRRWYIVVPVFVIWTLVWAGSWLIPTVYQSEALILVEQQKVPEQYVVPNVNVNLQDRLQSMTQQILSRTRLQSTINRFHLYEKPGPTTFLKAWDPIEQMRRDIAIELVEAPGHPGQLTAFKIRYSAGSPQLAQQVNSELTSLFIDENLKSQQQLSESTTAFLQSQLTEAGTKLAEQEAKVRAFKSAHFGNLPSQVQTNVQILSGLQGQLQSAQRALDGANQQKLYLESLQQEYQSVEATLDNGTSASPRTLNQDLLDSRKELQEAQLRYTEDHPDVAKLKGKVAKLEKLKQDLDAKTAAGDKPGTMPNSVDLGAASQVQRGSTSSMMQIQSQIKANRLEIQNYERQTKKITADIAAYEGRLNLTPATEQQLADISRGYEESAANYKSLLQKQNQSQLATSLEQRQQGEQFHILDPPSLPLKPLAPNRLLISVAGIFLGFGVGAGLAAFLEMSDVRVRNDKDLADLIGLKVLIGIPHLDVPGENQSRVRARRMEFAALGAMAILMLIGNLYAFHKS